MLFSGSFFFDGGAAACVVASRWGLVLADQAGSGTREVLVLSGVAAGMGLVLAAAGYAIRRVLTRRLQPKDGHEDFTLAELRELKEKGLLSAEEYELIKGRVVDSLSLNQHGERDGRVGDGAGRGGSGSLG